VLQREKKVAGIVPPARRRGPGALEGQLSLFSGNFIIRPPKLRNKNQRGRHFKEIGRQGFILLLIKQGGRKFQQRWDGWLAWGGEDSMFNM